MKYIYIFLLFPFFLSAQSEFISNSSFGVKADLVVSLNNDFTGIGGDIGISLSSLFDIGFEYIEASYDPKYNIVSSGRMVYAAYNFRSKNNCLKVLLGYSHNSVSTEYLNLSLLEVTGPLLG
ncbi:MAG: hypothetical protein Q7S39_08045, partial [Ignavibacteria bacterium]|nr:hypothetical protein [Ignavibacteria bacterium]